MRRFYFRGLGGLALLGMLLAAGCGSSADGEESSAPAVSKAEFIEKADAICRGTDEAQKAAERAFRKASPAANSRKWNEEYVIVVGLPPIRIAAEELDKLRPPRGDEQTVEEIVEALEEAVDEARFEPSSMLGKNAIGPFTKVFKLAKAYGFKDCSTPI